VTAGQEPRSRSAARVQAARLRAAFPAFWVDVLMRPDGRFRYEVVRRDGGPGLYCLISPDPHEIWRELGQPVPPVWAARRR